MKKNFGGQASNPLYGIGVFGAAVYFVSHATGFWNGAVGLLKAIVWPGYLVYSALEKLGV